MLKLLVLMWLIYGLFKVTLMGASFDQFQTCSSCVAAGHGWSSAKHRCGGFKTRRCEPQEEAQPGNGAKDELQVQDPGCVDLPVLCKGRAPLVIVRRGALSEQQLSGLETLTAKVERNGCAIERWQRWLISICSIIYYAACYYYDLYFAEGPVHPPNAFTIDLDTALFSFSFLRRPQKFVRQSRSFAGVTVRMPCA